MMQVSLPSGMQPKAFRGDAGEGRGFGDSYHAHGDARRRRRLVF